MSQHLLTPHGRQHKHPLIALGKQCSKKNKEAAEYAKLLDKRMKEAKGKHQEQITEWRRLSSLRTSTSKPESSQKSVFKRNKQMNWPWILKRTNGDGKFTVGELAQWAKTTATKPENPNSIPGTPWWKERTCSGKLSADWTFESWF